MPVGNVVQRRPIIATNPWGAAIVANVGTNRRRKRKRLLSYLQSFPLWQLLGDYVCTFRSWHLMLESKVSMAWRQSDSKMSSDATHRLTTRRASRRLGRMQSFYESYEPGILSVGHVLTTGVKA